ncbi:MAG: cupin domain-containing protein, partial [Thermacetogeniaceae bacterium]
DCRQWVEERFSRDRMVEDYLAVYQEVLRREAPRAHHANTPWGRWEVLLDEPTTKVKKITVAPGQRLSYQKHFRRKEHWYVVSGEALVTLDGKEIRLVAGEAIDIPKETAHRLANPGTVPLVLIETQTGEYLGEDDIIRLEDDYGRAQS